MKWEKYRDLMFSIKYRNLIQDSDILLRVLPGVRSCIVPRRFSASELLCFKTCPGFLAPSSVVLLLGDRGAWRETDSSSRIITRADPAGEYMIHNVMISWRLIIIIIIVFVYKLIHCWAYKMSHIKGTRSFIFAENSPDVVLNVASYSFSYTMSNKGTFESTLAAWHPQFSWLQFPSHKKASVLLPHY